jgi:hypothetical protein
LAKPIYTCVKNPKNPVPDNKHTYSDDRCVKANGATGPYGFEAFGQISTGLRLIGRGIWGLFGEVFGAEVSISGTGLECVGCMIEDGGEEAVGSGEELVFTGVAVGGSFAEKCEVAGEAIATVPLAIRSAGSNEVVIEPVSGETLANFAISAKSGKTCELAGVWELAGKVTGTAEGTTLNVLTGEGELLLDGLFPSTLEVEAEIEGGTTGGEYHPLGFT